MESLVRSLGINSLSINAYFSSHPSYASLHEGCGFPSQPLLCVKERSSQTWVKLKGHPWEMTGVMQMLEMTVICLLASLPIIVLHQRHPDAFPECGEVLRWGLKSHSLCFGFELAVAAEITSILIPPSPTFPSLSAYCLQESWFHLSPGFLNGISLAFLAL